MDLPSCTKQAIKLDDLSRLQQPVILAYKFESRIVSRVPSFKRGTSCSGRAVCEDYHTLINLDLVATKENRELSLPISSLY